MRKKQGFTLIEMLVVIAIIAILVSIVIPVVGNSTDKARAAADAANLRSTLGVLNIHVSTGGDLEEMVKTIDIPESVYEKDCELHVLYTDPGFIEIYFVKGSAYYGLDYLSAIAQDPNATGLSTAQPTTSGVWYQAGVGVIG